MTNNYSPPPKNGGIPLALLTGLICLTSVLISTALAENKILCVSAPNGLRYTGRDVELIGAAFGRYVGFDRDKIKKIQGEESTKDRIAREIVTWLCDGVGSLDLVVLFLAGHGVVVNDQYYFVPQLKEGEFSMGGVSAAVAKGLLLSTEELTRLLSIVPTRNKLLIIDSCRSGAMFDKPAAGADTFQDAGAAIRGLTVVPLSKPQEPSDRASRKIDFTVLSACKADQFAAEDVGTRNGVLTHYLVRVLQKRSRKESVFDAEDICKSVTEASVSDGWSQEAVAYGGNLFRVKLKKDTIPRFPTF